MEDAHTTVAAPAEPFDAARVIARSGFLGALVAFVITVVVSLIAGQNLVNSAAIASMPALFAGPLVAGLFVMTNWHNHQARLGLED